MIRPSITYNGKNSAEDFGLIVTEIRKPAPEKQIIRASVPYSDREPDFSRVNGKYSYKPRPLEYTFSLHSKSAKMLDKLISDVQDWLLNAPAGILQESYTPDWHFSEVTCDSCDPEYTSPTYAILKASFTAYPYRISNYTRPQWYSATSTISEKNYELTLDSCVPCFSATTSCAIFIGSKNYSIPSNSARYKITDIVFVRGANTFRLIGNGKMLIECIEEKI